MKNRLSAIFLFFYIFSLCKLIADDNNTGDALVIDDFNKVYNIKNNWKFRFYEDGDMSPIDYDYDDSGWYRINLPHSWYKKSNLKNYKDPKTGEPYSLSEIKKINYKT